MQHGSCVPEARSGLGCRTHFTSGHAKAPRRQGAWPCPCAVGDLHSFYLAPQFTFSFQFRELMRLTLG